MADPLPFRPPLPSLADLARARVREHCLEVTLVKENRTRRYTIRPGKLEGEWYCQVWFGDGTQHRGESTTDWVRILHVKAEYFREVDELERDGWTIAAGVDPRPQS